VKTRGSIWRNPGKRGRSKLSELTGTKACKRPINSFVPVAVTVIICVVITLSVFLVIRNRELEQNIEEFQRQAEPVAGLINHSINTHMEVLHFLKEFYHGSHQVDRDEFASFLDGTLEQYKGFHAIAWVPRVTDETLEEFKNSALQDGIRDFRLIDSDGTEVVTDSVEGREYFPVYYIEPEDEHTGTLGFDLSTCTDIRSGLLKAGETGREVLIEGFLTGCETAAGPYYMVISPVYTDGDTGIENQAGKDLDGFIIGVISITGLIAGPLEELGFTGIETFIIDGARPDRERIIYPTGADVRTISEAEGHGDSTAAIHVSTSIQAGDRTWTVVTRPSEGFMEANRPFWSWGVLLAGLLITVVLGYYLYHTLNRAVEIEKLVNKRTADIAREINRAILAERDLESRNRDLERSVGERDKAIVQAKEAQQAVLNLLDDANAQAEKFRILSESLEQTTSQLGERTSELETIIESSPMGIFLVDAETKKITKTNTYVVDLTGMEKEGLLGIECATRFPGIDCETCPILHGQQPSYITETEIKRKDGVLIPILKSAVEVVIDGRRQILEVFTDISELKEVQEALRQSEKQHRMIFESVTDGLLVFDPSGKIVESNPAACRMYGYTQEEFKELEKGDITHPDYRHLHSELLSHLGTSESYGGESVDIRKDGTSFNVEILGTTLNFRGQPHLLTVVRDITERKRTEKLLRIQRDVAFVIGSSDKPEVILEKLLSAIVQIDGIDCGSIYFEDKTEEKKCVMVGEGMTCEIARASFEMEPNESSMYMDALSDAVFNRTVDLKGRLRELGKEKGLKFVGVIPVKFENHEAAKLIIASKTLEEIVPEVRNTLEMIAAQIGGAIASAEAEQALRESEAKYRLIIENQSDLLIKLDLQGRFVFVSQSFCEVFGKDEAELIGMDYWSLVYGEDRKITAGIIKEGIENSRHEGRVIHRALTKDGLKWLSWVGRGITDNDGGIVEIVATGRDITAQKLAEGEFEKFKNISDNANSGSVIFDLDGNMTYVNNAFARMHGYTCEELVGQNFSVLHSESQMECMKVLFGKCLKSGNCLGEEVWHTTKDGTAIPTIMNGTTMKDEYGRPVYLSATAIDITELVNARDRLKVVNERLAETNEELERAIERANRFASESALAARAKSEFLANMSHEIRTPLNAVLGMTELVLDTKLDEVQEEYLGIVKSSADTLLNLINDILDLSKIEAGRISLEDTEFSLEILIGEVAKSFSHRIEEKKLKLGTVIDPDMPDALRGDPTRLKQVLINLVGNAVKFTEEGEIGIEVTAISDEGEDVEIEFTISDTGIGIASDKLENIFDDFVQADGSTTRKYGGTGLGLAISKRIVEAMSGEIKADSIEKVGSTFTFTVWFKRSLRSETDVVEESKRVVNSLKSDNRERKMEPDGRRINILVAEDNLVNQKVVVAMLKRLGHGYDIVEDGFKAITALDKMKYDLVLMDVQMPKLDGLEATRAIRLNPKFLDLPIIALTAYAMDQDRAVCLEAGMDDYLAKPIGLEDLAAKIQIWRYGRKEGMGDVAAMEIPEDWEVSQVLDVAGALERIGGDEELLNEVFELYLEDTPKKIAELGEYLRDGYAEGAKRIAHSIKGSSASIGAEGMRGITNEIQHLTRDGDVAGALDKLEEMETEFTRLVEALRKVIPS